MQSPPSSSSSRTPPLGDEKVTNIVFVSGFTVTSQSAHAGLKKKEAMCLKKRSRSDGMQDGFKKKIKLISKKPF
jgi:hypothetical protein